MAKKKKRSGGGGGGEGGGCGGGGGGQQQEHEDKADAGSGCEGKDKEKEKPDADDKDKGTGCKDDKSDKNKDKGCGGGKDDKGGKDKEKKPLPVVTAVLKVDMHCDGCAHRIRASVRRFPGVEGVAMDMEKGSMTVVGRFDAKKLRDRVAWKTKKKVELVAGKDNKGGGGDKQKCADGDGKQEPDKKEDDKEKEKKEQDDGKCGGGNAGKGKGGKDNKKPAVPVIVNVVLKIGSAGLHCDGCMHRIRCKLFKIKGVEQVKMDQAKNQVTVTGTMDAKTLPEKLRKKLRRPVDVVAPGKDKDKDKDKDKEKEGCNKDNGKQQGGGGDGKQCKEAAEKALAAELQLWKTAFYDQQAMQATEFLLSDENPNACAVM